MLSFLQVVVDVGLYLVLILFVVFVVLIAVSLSLALLVLVALSLEPFDDLGHLLIADRVAQVLRHTLEPSDLAQAPVSLCVADTWRSSYRVGLIDIAGEDSVEVEGVALGDLQSQTCAEVTPGASLCREVVGHRCSQLVDD